MKKTEIISKVGGFLTKARGKVIRHSPEILIIFGVAGVVTSAVMACRATTKISKILDETKETVDKIHEFSDDDARADYSEDDAKKDLVIVYAKTGLKFVKLYAPSVIIGVLSLTAILTSHRILRQRVSTLAALCLVTEQNFKTFRDRVAARFGEDVEREIRYDIKSKQTTENVVDPVTGDVSAVEKMDSTCYPFYSEYARVFDETIPTHEKNADYNKNFLITQQRIFNHTLQANGYVFLSDVYLALGFKETKESRIVGWYYDPANPKYNNYISFDIFDPTNPAKRNFINGYEYSIILDFNVDGPIIDLI